MPRLQQSIAILTACVVAAALQPLFAQQSLPDPVQQAGSFITPQTFVVARLDLQKLDPAALRPMIEKFVGKVGEGDAAPKAAQVVSAIAAFKQSLLDAGAAGQVYLMIGVPTPRGAPSAHFVVVMRQGASPGEAAIESIRKAVRMQHARLIRGAVVAAESGKALDEIAAATGLGNAERPSFAAAARAVEPALINEWIIPSDDHRRVLEEMMPQLPPELGGGPVTVLTRGLQWAAASVQAAPAKSLTLRIQSADAQSAAALKQFIMDNLRRPAVAEPAPGTPAAALGLTQILQRLAAVLDIEQRDNQLVVQLNDQQMEQLVQQALTPALLNARQSARMAMSMNNLKQLALAVHMYADAHKNLPDTLEELKPYLEGDAGWKRVMTHPATGRFPGYRYARPGKPFKDVPGTSDHPMIVEAFEQWPGRVAFAFADGHVQVVSDPALAQELLKQMGLELTE